MGSYIWKNVLTLEDVEDKMKEDIFYKLLKASRIHKNEFQKIEIFSKS